METRRPAIIVGAVTLALVVALFAFILWLSNYSARDRRQYDMFFNQSVAGLSVGSTVSFSGVPVGQVERIALMPDAPEFVRVRISVGQDVPILEGTTGAIQASGFTGAAVIQLTGAMRGAAPISAPGPFGVPVIPTRTSGFSQILEAAPEVVERASVLLARLNELLSDENRAHFSRILDNVDRASTAIAEEAPRVGQVLAEAQGALKAANGAAERLAAASASADRMLAGDGKAALQDLSAAARRTEAATRRLDALLATAQPGLETLSADTIPELNRLLAELRTAAVNLDLLVDQAATSPGGLLAPRALPDYEPDRP